MSVVIICRSALADSVLGDMALAIELAKRDKSPLVVLTAEALRAIAGQSFAWSPLLQTRPVRMGIIRAAAEQGYPLAAEWDKRWADLSRLMQAAREAGVQLVACPIWQALLGIDSNLPDFITRTNLDDYLGMLESADTVIGGY